jgi:Fe-S cluster assembly ATP-binding protein
MGHPKFTVEKGELLLDNENIISLSTNDKAKKGIFLSMQYLPEIAGVTLNNFLFKAYKAQKGEGLTVLEFYKMAEARAKEIGLDPGFLKRQVGAGLSGGEKKQAEMLQAVVLLPKFVLLDEVDSGVDVDALEHVLSAIKWLRAHGAGVLLITHYDTLLKKIEPDRVHIMKQGKLVASGGHELADEIKKKGFTSL